MKQFSKRGETITNFLDISFHPKYSHVTTYCEDLIIINIVVQSDHK